MITLSMTGALYRHEVVIPGRVDPAQAAAALAGERRILLERIVDGSVQRTILAVGELSVVSTGLAVETPDRLHRSSVLTQAVAHLQGLHLIESTRPEERRWFGVIGFDAVRDMERLSPRKSLGFPVYDFFFPAVLIYFQEDHALVVGRGASHRDAATACFEAAGFLWRSTSTPLTVARTGPAAFSLAADDYYDVVRTAKRHIVDGDVFQVVLSMSAQADSDANGLAAYQELARSNPSAYQFWYRSETFEITGCSPEPCVLLDNRRALIRPLAGTRPRGAGCDEDRRVEEQLRSSLKELAEHRMLVDLARNDLGRVCEAGTVTVRRLLGVERYSHVMHLSSEVTGHLGADSTAADLIHATFPAGTMTGAPKIRAIEVIDDLEPEGRGLYSGAVGSFGPDTVSLFLTIRAAVFANGKVRLQAGGGIVLDSDEFQERDECLAKMAAPARAVGLELWRGAR